jgi:hypothetical protein
MSTSFYELFNGNFSQALSLCLTTASYLRDKISVLVNNFDFKKVRKAPDQNRTDTNSLEGYGSTIELQAHSIKEKSLYECVFFYKKESYKKLT